MAKFTNQDRNDGSLQDVIKDADVFIGVSVEGALTKEMVESMAKDPIIFAMANPNPEIMPEDARAAGASVIGTYVLISRTRSTTFWHSLEFSAGA